jgi:hypothetical protein
MMTTVTVVLEGAVAYCECSDEGCAQRQQALAHGQQCTGLKRHHQIQPKPWGKCAIGDGCQPDSERATLSQAGR